MAGETESTFAGLDGINASRMFWGSNTVQQQICTPCLGESTRRYQACLQQSALLNSIVPAGNRNTMACVDNQECAVATALALPSVLFPFCSSCPRFSCLQQPKLFAVLLYPAILMTFCRIFRCLQDCANVSASPGMIIWLEAVWWDASGRKRQANSCRQEQLGMQGLIHATKLLV